jgi:hypothetical protein
MLRQQEEIRRRRAFEASLTAHPASGYPAFNELARMPDGVDRRIHIIEAIKNREHRRKLWARNMEHAAVASEREAALYDHRARQSMQDEEKDHYGRPEARWEEDPPNDYEPASKYVARWHPLVPELSPRDRAPALPTRKETRRALANRPMRTRRLWYDAPDNHDVFYDARQYGGKRRTTKARTRKRPQAQLRVRASPSSSCV